MPGHDEAMKGAAMCETQSKKGHGWKGWSNLPAPKVSGAIGAWVDLSHRITEELSRIPSFPQPRIRRIREIPPDHANVTEVHMVVHHGTHLDAPRHFLADGPTMDEIPLERLYGQGVVWHIDVPDHGVIDVAELERATPRMKEGDIVMIDTGRARHINTPKYMDHAHLTAAAAAWLVKQGAKIVGVDFGTPDLASNRRPDGFDFPVHNTLLPNGILIAEHVTGLSQLAGHRTEMMFFGINIAGSDGAPVRPVARIID
jgi:arylformamidase